MVIKFSGNQQELLPLSKYLKLEDKSGFNFLKTRFDWERVGFAKHKIFSLWDQIFEGFFVNANKGGYSSHFLQSRILEKRF